MGRKKTFFDWWNERLKVLSSLSPSPEEIYEYVKKIIPGADKHIYKAGPWSAIKLSIIAYYQDVYTVVAKSYFPTVCYVDTFAGSGLVKIREYNRVLYGSPLLAILATRHNKKFDRLYFIELDSDRAKILRQAVNYLAKKGYVSEDQVAVIPCDMNRINYEGIISKCSHALFCVDPEGTEPHWKTIESILKLPVDFSMNFMTAGIRRSWGTFKNDPEKSKAMTLFFGDNSWIQAKNEIDLLGMYINKIRKLRSIVETVEVKGPKAFHYHIIFAVRKTKGGNPWINAVRNLKEKVEQTPYDTFKRLLDVFYGKVKTLF